MCENIKTILFEAADKDYKEFHKKLIPEIDEDRIIGIRTPELRKIAVNIFKNEDYLNFISKLPHYYYEENNLHAFIIEQIKDYSECIKRINLFLPYIDNWATCDMMRPKCFQKNTAKLISEIDKWISSGRTYSVRFAIVTLMTFYLDDLFKEEYMQKISEIRCDDYYINMAIAWYFATALAKQKKAALKYIENKALNVWVHNKAIQKALESKRINEKDKQYLKKLKVNK